MRKLLLILSTLFALPAFANDDAARIGRQTQACWVVPSGLLGKNLTATLKVDLDSAGNVLKITVAKAPSGEDGKVMVATAKRALWRCAPYTGLSETSLVVNFSLQ